jgi:hypothetical protein
VQLDAADELHVIGDHVPRELLPGDRDDLAQQPAAGFTHGGERFRQQFVEGVGDGLPQLRLEATAPIRTAQFVIDALAFGRILGEPLLLLELRDLLLEPGRALGKTRTEERGLRLQLLVGHRGQPLFDARDLIDDRLDPLLFTFMSRAEHAIDQTLQHAVLER